MSRRVFYSLLAGAALGIAFSCKTFDLPAETCNPSAVYAAAPNRSGDDCARCLEDHCCDAVGVCERTNDCAKIVSDTHACVLAAGSQGARVEQSCAATTGLSAKNQDDTLAHPEADGAYRCMRGECGAQCALPVCKVDKAAPLIRNARCDECFAGGCCAPLNRCYENRACKLMLECIVSTCGGELGPALDDPSGDPPGDAEEAPVDGAALCVASAPPEAGIPECVRACLCRYRANDQGLPAKDRKLSPINLARSVYVCGKTAKCGPDCTPGPDDAGHD